MENKLGDWKKIWFDYNCSCLDQINKDQALWCLLLLLMNIRLGKILCTKSFLISVIKP
jgi:hypothetical protein